MLRSRPCPRADTAAVEALHAVGISLEPVSGVLDRVFEIDSRVVAAGGAALEEIAAPIYRPEPLPPIAAPWAPGPHRALIGTGLVVAATLPEDLVVQIHRLARTLAGQEHGARYTVVRAPVPTLEWFDVGGAVQQIAAGGIKAPAITIPLTEGYWPIGTIDHEVVMVRRNEAF